MFSCLFLIRSSRDLIILLFSKGCFRGTTSRRSRLGWNRLRLSVRFDSTTTSVHYIENVSIDRAPRDASPATRNPLGREERVFDDGFLLPAGFHARKIIDAVLIINPRSFFFIVIIIIINIINFFFSLTTSTRECKGSRPISSVHQCFDSVDYAITKKDLSKSRLTVSFANYVSRDFVTIILVVSKDLKLVRECA